MSAPTSLICEIVHKKDSLRKIIFTHQASICGEEESWSSSAESGRESGVLSPGSRFWGPRSGNLIHIFFLKFYYSWLQYWYNDHHLDVKQISSYIFFSFSPFLLSLLSSLEAPVFNFPMLNNISAAEYENLVRVTSLM